MEIQRRKRTAQIAILVLAPLIGILVASCGGGDATGSQSALDSREFQSVVQEARDAGLTPYWLGQEFQAASSTVELVADAKFYGPEQPMLSIMYRMAQPAAGRVSLLVYSKAHGG
ncbi:MAG: hypothetical protein Q8S13_03700 [Dehalococcoidia bacterium]|nr:hypothetical protein [Dehalococcoidia bacterium]